MADPSDDELIELFRRGDRTAFRLLIQRHDGHLYRIARSVVLDDQEAEDAVQETYFRAFTHLREFRGEASLATWLSRIALNEAMRRRRARSALGPASLDTRAGSEMDSHRDSMTSTDPDPEWAVAQKEVRQILEQAIDRLPETFRIVFVLRDVEEVSAKEAASLLGIREETVKTRLHRARRMLRQILGEQLALALKDVFPFAGERCDRLIEALWSRLLATSVVKPPS
jgi:RNA polymerase sigma-70 factor (ECF subfamily)